MSQIRRIAVPDDRMRRAALEQFDQFLRDTNRKENEWQEFFENNPLILSEALPVRFSAFCTQLRLESGQPDFVFVEDA